MDVAARSARIELVYRPGRRFRFGALGIERTVLDASLVERLAAYPEGEPYDAGGIVEVSRRLSQSGYFERVDVNPRIDRPVDGTIPVDVLLTPRKRHAFTAGAGITTRTDGRPPEDTDGRCVARRRSSGDRSTSSTECLSRMRTPSG